MGLMVRHRLALSPIWHRRKKPGCDAAGLSFVPISIVAGFREILGHGKSSEQELRAQEQCRFGFAGVIENDCSDWACAQACGTPRKYPPVECPYVSFFRVGESVGPGPVCDIHGDAVCGGRSSGGLRRKAGQKANAVRRTAFCLDDEQEPWGGSQTGRCPFLR